MSPAAPALAEIAERHGVAPAAVTAVQSGGEANHVYFLGDRLVLRIARDRPAFVADLVKEAMIIPAVRELGVRTPAMIEFDDSGTVTATPYLVLERAPGGRPEVPERPTDDHWGRLYREVGAELAGLHRGAPHPAGSPLSGRSEIRVDSREDPRDGIPALAAAGQLNAADVDWLITWFDRLAAIRPDDHQRTLIHGDLSPTNLLADPATAALTAIIDWGDAAWADPATDFAKLPLRAVPYALDGYLAALGVGDPEIARAWASRILWQHLSWAINRLGSEPAAGAPHWSAPPASRLLDLLRFFLTDPPSPWSALR
ncbi:phosphotransferase family protein [Microlunatus speluncae]|uniref:phosphotransferase family protein n=1 Tax=Microlunatus speluncae TaxID=2594267 RepID=UPI0012663800|nr:aminoglycoside phosphotransferase family protein [Microlunatus speluncae]